METKYVIIMHNAEGHTFEESPLLDAYPKPNLIEHYLREGKYTFAKVEKRYCIGNFEEAHAALNQKRKFYETYYVTADGAGIEHGTYSEVIHLGFIARLKELGLPFKIFIGVL